MTSWQYEVTGILKKVAIYKDIEAVNSSIISTIYPACLYFITWQIIVLENFI